MATGARHTPTLGFDQIGQRIIADDPVAHGHHAFARDNAGLAQFADQISLFRAGKGRAQQRIDSIFFAGVHVAGELGGCAEIHRDRLEGVARPV